MDISDEVCIVYDDLISPYSWAKDNKEENYDEGIL